MLLIEVKNYRRPFGSKERHEYYAEKIKEIIESKLTTITEIKHVKVFNFSGEIHNHFVGTREKLVIFVDATHNLTSSRVDIIMRNKEFKIFTPHTDNKQIIIDGFVVAEYNERQNELNILFDLFSDHANDVCLEIFAEIMEKFNNDILLPKTFQDSWKNTANKETLKSKIITNLTTRSKDIIAREKREIENLENQIRDYKTKIKRAFDNLQTKRRVISSEEDYSGKIAENLINDLNLIIENEKIKDIHFKDNKFTIFTNKLKIYSSHGKIYDGAEYTVTINMDNSIIEIQSNNKRKSYWSTNDPHPHVNGRNGEPCLGNISSTIAELCSQYQLYAITLVCLDFLESANTEDVAGAYVVNWDEIDEKGNIIQKGLGVESRDSARMAVRGEDNLHECDRCGRRVEDLITVYEYIDDDGNASDRNRVCDTCCDECYSYNDDVEEYIFVHSNWGLISPSGD